MNTTCPFCQKQSDKLSMELGDYSIFKCVECCIEFNTHFPPKGTVEETFTGDYYQDVQKSAFDPQIDNYTNDPSYDAFVAGLQQLEQASNAALPDDGSKKILDIGSALGTFLKIAKDRGWEVNGVELSEFGVEYSRKKYGFEIHHGDVTTSNLSAQSFDAITMWDVIEHVEAPVANVQKAIELLKPNGMLLITSDSYDCIMAVVGRLLYKLSLGKFTYPVRRLFIPHNKSYFTPKGMESLFSRLNLEIVYFKRMEYPLEKIETSFLEKQALRIFYGLGELFNMQSQFTYVLRKKSD